MDNRTEEFNPQPFYDDISDFFGDLIERYSSEKYTFDQMLQDGLAALGKIATGIIVSAADYSNILNIWLYEHGWPPLFHVNLNTAPLLHTYCQDKTNEMTQAIVDKEVVKAHNKQVVGRIFGSWSCMYCLSKRIPILKQAVEAHLQGRYALSTPVILAQLEGIVAEVWNCTGQLKGKDYKNLLKQTLPSDSPININRLVYDFMAEKVLAQFEHGQSAPFDLNRHAILHGGDTDYATEKTSLKAILIFDFIAIWLNYEWNRNRLNQ